MRKASIVAIVAGMAVCEKHLDDLDQSHNSAKNSAYDEYGRIRYNGKDICDCTSETCPSC